MHMQLCQNVECGQTKLEVSMQCLTLVATPFVFRGHLNQSTTDSKVKQFDLQESLARKITWKPHRGKLQPFVAPDAYKVPPKEVKVQSR